MEYLVRRARSTPELLGRWESLVWWDVPVISVSHFHPKSAPRHRPQTEAKMLYDDDGIYVIFHVRDRYVICRNTEPQSPVCKDSCVEAFFQPKPDHGYFNIEINCGGAILLYYVTDPTKFSAPEKGFVPVETPLLRKIRIFHVMPRQVLGEITTPVEWTIEYFVPNSVFEAYVGPLGPPADRQWRGNFFKCADDSSHPHWASWNPIGEALNFHVPRYFAPIRFEPPPVVRPDGRVISRRTE